MLPGAIGPDTVSPTRAAGDPAKAQETAATETATKAPIALDADMVIAATFN